jgi:hypothetical protein
VEEVKHVWTGESRDAVLLGETLLSLAFESGLAVEQAVTDDESEGG